MKLYKIKLKNVYIVIETCYFHMNMKELVFHADST